MSAGITLTAGVRQNLLSLQITVNGTDRTIALADSDTESTILSKINAVTDTGGGSNEVHASVDGSHHLVLTALNSDVDFTVNASSTDITTTALGLTEGTAHNS